ncbi:phage major capsid protein [Xinfangfangia sp. D13-10-4-6]|uniref:phage major capsid protein n=1 Tax=Pseudogemmobacter hezensis TaxID=2737662 RepID=UPI0015537A72|nr:phage major capsid protein [Pseudogemmobacter hezensis]NPD17586.1 phage major capsid protein [Pseudogemmobacter hezensis]
MGAHHNFGPLETKSEAPPDVVKDAIKQVMTGFEEYKTSNDERLKQIETKGAADPVTTEKLAKLDAHLDKFEGMNQRLTEATKKAEALDELKTRFDTIETAMRRTTAGVIPEVKAGRVDIWARAVVDAATAGVINLSQDQQKALKDVAEEFKALSVSVDTAGGYLAPVELVREIIKGETEISPVRSLARVRTTAQKSVDIPKRTGQFAAQWVAEQGTRSETPGLAYGVESIPTHEVYALIDISNQMLEDSAFNMEQEISMEAIEQFAVAEGAAFVTGNGVGKPQGFMSAAGVATTISGAATTVTADGLLTLKHAIKTAYTRSANFVMNRTTLGSIRKLKDSTGQYLWMPGIAQGKPNTIDGDPYVELPDMPGEGAGAKPVAYGDFRRAYTWIDRISMEMLRDPYTQATAGNVRFILRKRVGGQVTLAEAIRTLTCQAA